MTVGVGVVVVMLVGVRVVVRMVVVVRVAVGVPIMRVRVPRFVGMLIRLRPRHFQRVHPGGGFIATAARCTHFATPPPPKRG